LLLTVASGLHAASVPDSEIRTNRVAYFSNLIQKRLWFKVAYKLPDAAQALSEDP